MSQPIDSSSSSYCEPLIATYACHRTTILVKCEGSGDWIPLIPRSVTYTTTLKIAEWAEKSCRFEYRFYKIRSDSESTTVTAPAGYWLSDGRLVSTSYSGGKIASAFYGSKEELLSRRSVCFVSSGPDNFLSSSK